MASALAPPLARQATHKRVLFFVGQSGCAACAASLAPVKKAARIADVGFSYLDMLKVSNAQLDANVQVTPTFFLVQAVGGGRGKVLAKREGAVQDQNEFARWLLSY